MTDITEAELYQAIEEAFTNVNAFEGLEPNTTTTPRVAERYKVSHAEAMRTLTQMWKEGKIKPDKVIYTDPWGCQQRVKGWRLIS